MKNKRRKIGIYFSCILFIMGIVGCSAEDRNSAKNLSENESVTSENVVSISENTSLIDSLEAADVTSENSNNAQEIPEEFNGNNVIKRGTGYYHCEFEKDRKFVEKQGVDIVVGDNLYMTQINDWFTNFNDYDGKTVEIEGYFIDFSPYTFIGRYGPSCPYCTGGYVDFEFITDQDISSLSNSKSWIKMVGILRKGYDTDINDEFYYIEATTIEVLDEVGQENISN